MVSVVSIADTFQGTADLPYLLSLPIPLLNDLFEARIEYLTEKRKAQEEEMKNHQNG